MHGRFDRAKFASSPVSGGTVRIAARNEIAGLLRWRTAFAGERKDRRFYELFDYGYFVVDDGEEVCAIQPFFVVDQDLVAGASDLAKTSIAGVRRLWPRFLRARTLMVGCAAGEGRLDGDETSQSTTAELLARSLHRLAGELNCAMIVLKEFPAEYRAPLQCLQRAGFTRTPSMPMTTLSIDFADFEDYLSNRLSPGTRAKVRRKLRAAERAQPAIAMSLVDNVTAIIEDVYPLYLKVFERSSLRFEKLTKEFLCEIANRIPDKALFFVWRQDSKIIAFGLCTVQGDRICHEYVGFDYSVAFKLNMYYRVFHDIIEWAIANGYKRFYSGSLNYDPKWHLRQSLYPLDLYVRHSSRPINALLRWLLPLLEPTHSDPILPNFHNYRELWQ